MTGSGSSSSSSLDTLVHLSLLHNSSSSNSLLLLPVHLCISPSSTTATAATVFMMYLLPPSHIDQAVVFGTLGLWHLFNTLRKFIKQPSAFRSRTWFPSPFPGPFRYLELWSLLLIVVFFICRQLYRARSDFASGAIQTPHLQRYQHVSFAVIFLIYVVAALCSRHAPSVALPDGVLHATFALGFMVELLVFHLGHHPGDSLESFVHQLMQIILGFLSLLMLLEILWPHSVLVSVGRCMALVFKGTWFFQIGALINFESAIPLGCEMGSNGFPECPEGVSLTRARSIQVLVFAWQIAGILIFTYGLYWVLVSLDRIPTKKGGYGPVGLKVWEEPDGLLVVDEEEALPVLSVVPGALSKRKSQNSRVSSNPNIHHVIVSPADTRMDTS